MWEISNNAQLYSFLMSVIFGMGYCVFYDVFRSIRRVKKHCVTAVFFEDILYFAVIGIVTFLLQLAFSAGEIRLYLLFGILLGFLVWNFTLSRFFVKISVFLIGRLAVLIKLIYGFLSGILSKISVFLAKIALKLKKTVKKRQKKENNP